MLEIVPKLAYPLTSSEVDNFTGEMVEHAVRTKAASVQRICACDFICVTTTTIIQQAKTIYMSTQLTGGDVATRPEGGIIECEHPAIAGLVMAPRIILQ